MNFSGWNDINLWVDNIASGEEKIGVGIRPYGLHAGNLTALVAYPYLLCEQFKKREKKEPRFDFDIWLNDIEPVSYVGADGRRESADAANMYAGETTFQFSLAPDGFQGSLVDYWQPVIEGVVRGVIGAEFPKVKLEFRRASELVSTPQFKQMVHKCLTAPEAVGTIIEKYTRSPIRGAESFVWPLCPDCHAPIIPARRAKPPTNRHLKTTHP